MSGNSGELCFQSMYSIEIVTYVYVQINIKPMTDGQTLFDQTVFERVCQTLFDQTFW